MNNHQVVKIQGVPHTTYSNLSLSRKRQQKNRVLHFWVFCYAFLLPECLNANFFECWAPRGENWKEKMVDWQQKLTNYISVYLLCSKKFVRNILLLSCGELVGLFICASYIARSAPGLGQLQHPLAFSGTSHIFQLQLHLGSPHSAPKKEQEEIGVSNDQALYSMFSWDEQLRKWNVTKCYCEYQLGNLRMF